MIQFPNAKINLGLNIVAKRSDGFHDIETVFYPVGLQDALEIIPANDGKTEFTSSGIPIPGSPESNLCLRALDLLKSGINHPSSAIRYQPSAIPAVKIHLHKVIPMGAGLGGGSSDGAFTLKVLNDLFALGLSSGQLSDYARELGSDAAFFIENKPVFAFQRGNYFKPLDLLLSPFKIALVIPPLHISTPEAYSLIKPQKPEHPVDEVIRLPVKEWKENLVNDFEKPVMEKYPLIREIKEKLYQKGAAYASMSGSGSAVYGIFNETPDLRGLFPESISALFSA